MSELYLMTTIIDRNQSRRFVSFYQELRIYNTRATGEERSGLIGDKPLQWCLRTTK